MVRARELAEQEISVYAVECEPSITVHRLVHGRVTLYIRAIRAAALSGFEVFF